MGGMTRRLVLAKPQCDKLVTVVGHQFTLSVHICVQHDGREAAHRAGLSAAAETCTLLLTTLWSRQAVDLLCVYLHDNCRTKTPLT